MSDEKWQNLMLNSCSFFLLNGNIYRIYIYTVMHVIHKLFTALCL